MYCGTLYYYFYLFKDCSNPKWLSTAAFQCDTSSAINGTSIRARYKSDRYSCISLFDGKSVTFWATDNEDVGSWIQIQFPQTVWLTNIKYQHSHGYINNKYREVAKFKNVSFEFSDGSQLTTILPKEDSKLLNFELKYPKLTTSLRITANSVYPPAWHGTKKSYGIAELTLDGCNGM